MGDCLAKNNRNTGISFERPWALLVEMDMVDSSRKCRRTCPSAISLRKNEIRVAPRVVCCSRYATMEHTSSRRFGELNINCEMLLRHGTRKHRLTTPGLQLVQCGLLGPASQSSTANLNDVPGLKHGFIGAWLTDCLTRI